MKKVLYAALALLLLAPALAPCAEPGKEAPLQYDGLYRAPGPAVEDMPSWYYLRFYPDGAVISATSPGSPQQVARWFNRRYPNVAYGQVANDEGRLSFTLVSQQGMVDYHGGLRGNKLHFDTYNHSDGKRGSVDYDFMPVAALADTP